MIPTVQYLLHENMQRKQKLEIYQYLGAAATKRLLEVDSLTSIDLSNNVGVIVHLPSDYVYFSTSSRAKDCKGSAAELRQLVATTLRPAARGQAQNLFPPHCITDTGSRR